MKRDEKEVILSIIKKEPQGLTIQDITRAGKMNRFTVTIYVHELLGEGKITERKIGAYRLFYLKQRYLESVKEREIIERIKQKIK